MVDIFAKEGIKVDQKPQKTIDSYFPPISTEDLNAPQPKISGSQEPVLIREKDLGAPKDIFKDMGISQPTVSERNQKAISGTADLNNPKNDKEVEAAKAIDQHRKDLETLAATRFTPEQIASFKDNPITWKDAGKFLNAQNTLPAGGVFQAFDLVVANRAAKKLEQGASMKDLSVNESETLNKIVDTYIEQEMRGFSVGGGIRYGVSQMPAFAIEFIASGGVGKLAEVAAVKGIEKAATKLAVKGVTKGVATKAVGVSAQVAARTVAMPAMYAPKYAERRFNDAVSITDKGELLFKQSEESPAKSALLAFGYSSAEVASEMAGGAIGKYFLDPVKGVLKTPLTAAVNKLPVEVKAALYEAYKKINPNAQVSKLFTQAGWNGMIEEMGEEQVSRVLQATMGYAANDTQSASDGKNFTFADYMDQMTPTADQLMIEGGVIAIAGGVKTSADLSFNILKNKGIAPKEAQQIVDNMSATEQEKFVEQNLETPKAKHITEIEQDKIQAPSGMSQFVDLARKSKNVDEFISSVREIKGVTADVIDFFGQKYGGEGSNIRAASERFIDDVANGKYDPAEAQRMQDVLFSKVEAVKDKTQSEIADGKEISPMLSEAKLHDQALRREHDADPRPINNSESMADQFIKQVRNELHPIHKLAEIAKDNGIAADGVYKTKKFSDVELTSRMYSSVLTQAQHTIEKGTFYYDDKGNAVQTGKGLVQTVDDFDNYFMEKEPSVKERRKDFTDYLIAQRYLQDLANREDVEVTEEQKVKSAEDLARLALKYGEDFKFFDTFAKEIYEFQKNVLNRLVVSGNMSQDKFDQITRQNKNYIPFQRVLDEVDAEGNSVNADTKNRVNGAFKKISNATINKVIKKLRGSDKEIKDPITSIIMNTYRITQLALTNDAARSVSNYAAVMPEYVQKVEAPIVKKGTATVKVAYDKRLREKLKATIEMFGEEFQQKKTLNQKGQRGLTLGDYSPQEKLVRLRLGSSDAVLAHEVGHLLDFRLGLGAQMLSDPKVKKELQKLAEERLAAQTKVTEEESGAVVFQDVKKDIESEKHVAYVKNDREVIANFFDAYVNAPDLLDKIAPKAKKIFEKIIDAEPKLSFIKDIKPSLERGVEEIQQDVWGEADYAPKDTITVFNNGQKEYYKVSKPILEAMTRLSPAQLNLFDRLIAMPLMTVFRMGATLNPEFMLRSIPREGLNTFITNRDVKYSPANYARGFFAVVQNAITANTGTRGFVSNIKTLSSFQDLYDEFSRSARFSAYMDMNEQSAEKHFSSLISGKGRIMQYATNPLKILEEVGMAVDQIARVGAFDAAKKAGFSDLEAAMITRDVFDYTRGGSTSKAINRYVPFFKAGINGADKLYRAFKEKPKETTFWALMTVTMPSIALASYYLYFAPDDEKKEYLEIPDSLRSVFWFYKDDGEWKKIPKPFQIGQLFGSLPELAMIWMHEENKPEGSEMAKIVAMGTVESAMPFADWSSLIPLFAKLPAEWASNYNFFFGKNIYPEFLDNKDPEFRVNSYTSETAKAIGDVFDVSPAKVDNALSGVLAGSAKYLTSGGDAIINQIKEFNGETVPEKPITKADVLVMRAFFQRRPSGFRSNSYQSFSDTFDQVEQRYHSSKDLEGDKKAEYDKKHAVELSMYKTMNGYKKQMSKVGKEIDAVYENKTMSSEEKVDRIGVLEDMITDIAREANMVYNKAARGEK